MDEPTRVRIREALDGFDTGGNARLNSSLFEALAAHCAIEPINTAGDIRAEIAAVLAVPDRA
ncbi:MAG: hypothetical protein ACT4P1_10645 [Sporichthyaceae bacterium]